MRNLYSHFLGFSFILFSCVSQAQSSAGTAPSFKLSGDASLVSNYVERGLTRTKKDPALIGSFLFNFGSQFRLGLNGSNIAYEGEDAHFNLKLLGDLKVTFSPSTELIISYVDDQYYKSKDRKGTITGLSLNSNGYRIQYRKFSNWEKTADGATWYSLGADLNLGDGLIVDSNIGYTSPESSSYKSYLDFSFLLKRKTTQITWSGGVAGSSTKVDNRGGIYVVVGAKTEF